VQAVSSAESGNTQSDGPVSASIHSVHRIAALAINFATVPPKKDPIRLAMKFGVSLHCTTPLP
jgi:hypothetical protein